MKRIDEINPSAISVDVEQLKAEIKRRGFKGKLTNDIVQEIIDLYGDYLTDAVETESIVMDAIDQVIKNRREAV